MAEVKGFPRWRLATSGSRAYRGQVNRKMDGLATVEVVNAVTFCHVPNTLARNHVLYTENVKIAIGLSK